MNRRSATVAAPSASDKPRRGRPPKARSVAPPEHWNVVNEVAELTTPRVVTEIAVAPTVFVPADPTEIRDLIMARIPHGPQLVLNVASHDGLIDVMIQCGALRWNDQRGIGTLSAEAVADAIEGAFRAWIAKTLGNIFEDAQEGQRDFQELTTDHYRRAGRGFQAWMRADPRARAWLRDVAA